MIEEWKSIPGYEGYYSVSNMGNVRRDVGYKNTFAGKVLIPGKGIYLRVSLSKNSKSKSITIHSLVLLAFVGKRPEGFQINHKNGIKYDNRLENLEYCTVSQNNFHAYKIGLKTQKGEKNAFCKYSRVQVLEAKELFKSGKTTREVSKITGMNFWSLKDIRKGKLWNHTTLLRSKGFEVTNE